MRGGTFQVREITISKTKRSSMTQMILVKRVVKAANIPNRSPVKTPPIPTKKNFPTTEKWQFDKWQFIERFGQLIEYLHEEDIRIISIRKVSNCALFTILIFVFLNFEVLSNLQPFPT
jgi:hypothetical protein